MAIDYPDWSDVSGVETGLSTLNTSIGTLNTSIGTLNTSVTLLAAGYGTGIAIKTRQVANVPDGTNRILVPAQASKTATIVRALCAWQSVNDEELRGYIDIGISLDAGATFFIVVLTPESPTFECDFGFGAQATAVNQTILWTATAAAGAPATDSSISITAIYFQA